MLYEIIRVRPQYSAQCPLRKGDQDTNRRETPHKDIGRKWLSWSQGESLQKKINPGYTLFSRVQSLQECETMTFCWLSDSQSVVFCLGSASKLILHPRFLILVYSFPPFLKPRFHHSQSKRLPYSIHYISQQANWFGLLHKTISSWPFQSKQGVILCLSYSMFPETKGTFRKMSKNK